jgi:nicotinate dehydrogenase subunit B
MLDIIPTRRDLLLAAGGLFISFGLPGRPQAAEAQVLPAGKPVSLDQVDSFLAIDPGGHVTVYSGKVDLGTGVRTAITQIVAEELDVPPEHITVISGDTALTPDQGASNGSNSIQVGGVQIRQAAATARRALLDLAAKHLQVQPATLSVQSGQVTGNGQKLPYGALLANRNFAMAVDKTAPTKNPADFKIVGTSFPRLDIPDKVTGRFTYMHNVTVDGMLHGRVVRPPAMEATLLTVDEASVKDVPGLVKVVRDGAFLGVIAKTEWGAIKAAQMLKATWTEWAGLPEQAKLFEHVRATPIAKDEITSNAGDAATATDKAARKISASYDFAIHTHGSIGPSCAIVATTDGKLTCWSASQSTHNLRKQLAEMLSVPIDTVRCLYFDGAGCYGRNGHEDAAADAALLSRAVEGRPVRVQWMRADEHGWDPKGPPTLMDLSAGLDEQGEVVAWRSDLYTPNSTAPYAHLAAAALAGLPHEKGISPGGVTGDSAVPYGFPNVHTVAHRLADTPFRPSWIRTPGRLQNTFANESFLDELAAAAGKDPIAFRLHYLKDPRGIELLHRLQTLSKWETRPSPVRDQTGDIVRGRGVAYVKYEMVRTYIGAVAEVEVNRKTGVIKANRFYVAHDCGQIINPDGVRNQIEGNVVQTVSRTLMEEVTFDRSKVTSLDWASYPIITFPDVPEVVMDLIDRPNEKPWGAGEPSTAVVPGAISNAVFDATGVRMRSVPMTPSKLLAAMKAA